jgi:hypothetical protein
MFARLVGDGDATEHASDFFDACILLERHHLRTSGAAIGQFRYAKVTIA